jgi:Putative viral replication protein
MSAAKNWCFTLNNYQGSDIERIDSLVGSNERIKYVIYGKEVGESGTPHLQGFVSFVSKVRLNQVKTFIGSNPHVEVCRNVSASVQYCKKEGDYAEFGEMSGGSGTRNDLDEFKSAVKAGMLSLKDIREAHSEVYAKYTRFCLEYIQDNYPVVQVPAHELRPWQARLKSLLEQPACRRKIIFIVDETGNTGKSWFAHWYTNELGEAAQVMLPGKKADMAYALKPGLKVLFLDAPRSKQGEFIQYDFLEDLKNGYVFSPKYESRIKTYEPLHVVVNMNEAPDRTKLSEDRYQVINIRSLQSITATQAR